MLGGSCNPCCKKDNTCGATCPESLEGIAEDITITVTLTQWQELFFGNPTPFFSGQVIPCTFSRMQNGTIGSAVQRFAVYSSDPSVSQSSGTSSFSAYESAVSDAVKAVLDAMQRPQNLVELFVPCNESTQFDAGKYVITRFLATWVWVIDPPPLFGAASLVQYDMRTNLHSALQSGRPRVNCELSLSQKQNVLGYPFAFSNSGNPLPGLGYCDLQLEVNPLP